MKRTIDNWIEEICNEVEAREQVAKDDTIIIDGVAIGQVPDIQIEDLQRDSIWF